jgi:fructan beta-fructosidase
LRGKSHQFDGLAVTPGDHPFPGLTGNLLEVRAEAEVGDRGVFALNIADTPVVYDAIKRTLTCGDVTAPLAPEGQVVRLRILIDRGSIEVFGNDGRIAISRTLGPDNAKPGLSLTVPTVGPAVKFTSIRVHELGSAW